MHNYTPTLYSESRPTYFRMVDSNIDMFPVTSVYIPVHLLYTVTVPQLGGLSSRLCLRISMHLLYTVTVLQVDYVIR